MKLVHRSSGKTRRLAAGSVALLLASTLAACGGSGSGVPTINLYGGASATGFDGIIASCNKAAAGKYKIVGNLTPSDADSQREQFVRRLAAHDKGLDLLGMDVTWTAEFAEAGWIKELTGDHKTEASKDVLKPALDTALWKDKLYAIPKHTNVQLLWYRPSLTPEPPKTWDDMISEAKKLKSENKPYVVAVTGAQYEGLVVVFNTILASLGGTLVNKDSTKPTVNADTVAALKVLHDLATDGLASKSLSNSQEPEVFAQIQNSEAAFALNWPYVYGSMKDANPKVYKDLKWAPLPQFKSGEPSRATLGGMNYAISKFSKHPEQAFDAAMCLRSPANQLKHAENGNEPPVLENLYADPALQKAYPMYADLLTELKTAVPRPVTPLYQNISTIVSSTLSPPRSINPEKTAAKLKDQIQQAIEGKGILP